MAPLAMQHPARIEVDHGRIAKMRTATADQHEPVTGARKERE